MRQAGAVDCVGVPDGLCGLCRITKLEGDVRIDHPGGIDEADIADRYILACRSFARGDLVIEG
jgi:glycine betaine catabolism B